MVNFVLFDSVYNIQYSVSYQTTKYSYDLVYQINGG